MAVDEKYVENVRDDKEMEKILKEMGVEASYKPVSDNGIDLAEYDTKLLKDLIVGEMYEGTPILTDVLVEEFEDKYTGETTTRYRLELVLTDDDEREAYICKINLKNDDVVWENVSNLSGLYKLTMGLMELECPGISQYYNKLDKVSLKSLKKNVNKYETLTIRVTEESFTNNGEVTSYNSFLIVDGIKRE